MLVVNSLFLFLSYFAIYQTFLSLTIFWVVLALDNWGSIISVYVGRSDRQMEPSPFCNTNPYKPEHICCSNKPHASGSCCSLQLMINDETNWPWPSTEILHKHSCAVHSVTLQQIGVKNMLTVNVSKLIQRLKCLFLV